jgi:hypothetical protein
VAEWWLFPRLDVCVPSSNAIQWHPLAALYALGTMHAVQLALEMSYSSDFKRFQEETLPSHDENDKESADYSQVNTEVLQRFRVPRDTHNSNTWPP